MRASLPSITSCRGSSIGRACGSYNSEEINLKVVGSSPTFGYSYTHQNSFELLFFCFCFVLCVLLQTVHVCVYA
jgi:hypothetical protein